MLSFIGNKIKIEGIKMHDKEENAHSEIFLKTIESIEKITIAVIINTTSFSIFALKEFGHKKDLLEPFKENIPFSRFNWTVDAYEKQYFTKVKNTMLFLGYIYLRNLPYQSQEDQRKISGRLYYEKNYYPCPPEEKENILNKINALKNKEK